MTIGSSWRSFRRNRAGVAAIEFAMVAPLFFAIVFSSLEAGWMMTKATMLDRSLDTVIRSLRVGLPSAPQTQDGVRKAVCALTVVIPNCSTTLIVEMTPIQTAADYPTTNAVCRDRGTAIKPVATYNPGLRAETVFVRACLVEDPLMPFIGLALHLSKDTIGGYWLIATSAFVNEPGA